jgi:ATP-binding protein involved in chromosome partitioning
MLHQIIRQFLQQVAWGELDYLLIDLPPGTGDVVITLVQTVPLTGAIIVSTGSSVALQDARKALEMFHQVNVEVLGLVENMSQMTLPDGTVVDVFGAGGTQQTARQYNLPFLGSIDLDPQVRTGGDSGLPAALAGDATPRGREFLAIAKSPSTGRLRPFPVPSGLIYQQQPWPGPSQPVSVRSSPPSSRATSRPVSPSVRAHSRKRPSPTP